MRLFIGIKTGCEQHLVNLQQGLAKHGRGRMTEADNLHLTLKFLGEAPPSAVSDICAALDGIDIKPFRLECRGAHVFNKNGIVSAEVGGDMKSLFALQEAVELATEPLGFPRESRRFRAHITLARDFKPGDFCDVAAIPYRKREFEVKEVILFESTRINGRLTYVPLCTKGLM